MSVPNVPPTPPRQPRSGVATGLLLIAGLLLLAPGVCALIFIWKFNWKDIAQHFWEDLSTGGSILLWLILLWIISFIISAGGIGLIVYAFRRYRA